MEIWKKMWVGVFFPEHSIGNTAGHFRATTDPRQPCTTTIILAQASAFCAELLKNNDFMSFNRYYGDTDIF